MMLAKRDVGLLFLEGGSASPKLLRRTMKSPVPHTFFPGDETVMCMNSVYMLLSVRKGRIEDATEVNARVLMSSTNRNETGKTPISGTWNLDERRRTK